MINYEEIRADLEEHRRRLIAELEHADRPPEHGVGYTNHQADDASEAYEQAANLAIRENARRLLYDVERALDRMDAGTYGHCRNCGQPIDHARLKAIPYARYCLTCADRIQR